MKAGVGSSIPGRPILYEVAAARPPERFNVSEPARRQASAAHPRAGFGAFVGCV